MQCQSVHHLVRFWIDSHEILKSKKNMKSQRRCSFDSAVKSSLRFVILFFYKTYTFNFYDAAEAIDRGGSPLA